MSNVLSADDKAEFWEALKEITKLDPNKPEDLEVLKEATAGFDLDALIAQLQQIAELQKKVCDE